MIKFGINKNGEYEVFPKNNEVFKDISDFSNIAMYARKEFGVNKIHIPSSPEQMSAYHELRHNINSAFFDGFENNEMMIDGVLIKFVEP